MTPQFEQLIDRHHDEIFSYLWRLLGKARRSDVSLDVEDLVQDVFMRAYQAYPKLRPESNHRAWLYKIATNRAFTKLRRAKRERDKIALLTVANEPINNCSAPENAGAKLRAAVERLTPKQKACVSLRYFNDLDYAEIAASVGCSALSARSNVSQALRRLGKLLQEPS